MEALIQQLERVDWLATGGKLLLVVAGPLIGALIAFLAVGRQLSHDRAKHERDRQMTLRREVFLGAAEAVARLQEVLASFSNTSMGDLQRQALLQGSPGWLNKIHIIGSPETIDAFIAVKERFAETSIQLFKDRMQLDWLTLQRDNLRSEIQGMVSYQDQLLAELRALATRQPDHGEVERATQLVSWLDELRQRLDAARAEEIALGSQAQSLHRALTLKCARAPLDFEDRLIRMNLAIRKELDLPLPVEHYSASMKASSARLAKLFDSELGQTSDGVSANRVQSTPNTGPQPDGTAGAAPRG